MARRVDIEIEVTKSGEVRFTIKGMKGKGCLALAKPLEEALGTALERKHTDEYRQAEQVNVTGKTK